MKTEPVYGYFPRWPEDGDAWIHPEDVATARQMLPSHRVWRRAGRRGRLLVLTYGDIRLRVRPALWVEVEGEGFDVGDWVEVLSRMRQNTPRTGRIREMVWDDASQALRYQIVANDVSVPNLYSREDLRHVEPTPPFRFSSAAADRSPDR